MKVSDEQWVHQAQRGDKTAFAELFTRYEGRIYGYIYRMVGDRAWAEDLTQETFIQAHQHLGRLGPPYDFKSWVYRIAGNMALDGLRRYRDTFPLPDWDGGEAETPEPADQRREGDPEQQARLNEIRAAVWRTLHKLPDAYRQILILRELDGLAYAEIAVVLGISLDNVRVTLHRARLQFRDLYGIQVMAEEGRLACQELDDLLSAYVDGELDNASRKRVKEHIATCQVCQKKQHDLLTVSSLLACLTPVFPPPTLYTRFHTRLQHLPSSEPPAQATRSHEPVKGASSLGKGSGFMGRGPVFWLLIFGGGAVILLGGGVLLLLLVSMFLLSPSLSGFMTPTVIPSPTSAALPAMPSSIPTSLPSATPASPTVTPFPTSTSPPTIPPTLTSTPTPTPYIAFWADTTTVQAGNCTTLHWETANIQAVFFNGVGTPGIGTHQTCPCASEMHTLDVLLRDGSHDIRTVAIQVNGTCVTPTFTPSPTFTPTPDTQGPVAPFPVAPIDNVTLSCRSTMTLTWNAASDLSGIAGYTVRLEEQQARVWKAVGEWGLIKETQFSVPVSCGRRYRWAVQAQDDAGNWSLWSTWAQFGVGID
ncbi:MAG TPA: sigma-70 family RNA polymerase sigma factor [Anaerolineae bacterium]|nr:sigma-70 family RNA polymerase sigma factor [Anaerolineae bacterium]HQH38222.1 sigma-70 family RNA polymerase sigma factor [Anaerolineae bacterium]